MEINEEEMIEKAIKVFEIALEDTHPSNVPYLSHGNEDFTDTIIDGHCDLKKAIGAVINYTIEKMDKWQPIETAPKNETDILVYDEINNMVVTTSFDTEIEEWVMSWGIYKLTHWKPMSELPKKEINL